jgi:hypothetical protein
VWITPDAVTKEVVRKACDDATMRPPPVPAGEARVCYHGLPRIFTDRPLPECLQAHQEDPEWAQYVAHMDQARINISVRVVTDGTLHR